MSFSYQEDIGYGRTRQAGDPAIVVGVLAPDNRNYQAPEGFFGRVGGGVPTKIAGSPSPARHEGKAAPTHIPLIGMAACLHRKFTTWSGLVGQGHPDRALPRGPLAYG